MGIKRREFSSAGNAYADGRPRWEVRVRQPDGRQFGRTFTTRNAAEKWERDQLTSLDTGEWTDPRAGRVTLAQVAPQFLSERQRPLAPKTRELYDDLLERFILPRWGETRLASISTDGIRRWLADVSASSTEMQAAKCYRLLRAILNVAVADRVLARNPCTIRGAGQDRSPERPLATPEQLVALANVIVPHLRAFILLAGFGGLRRGELLALRREDIDIDRRTVRVNKQLVRLRKVGSVETKPKSAAGTRTITLPPFVVEELERHLEQFVGPGPSARVFVGEKGGPLSLATLYPAYERARVAAGVPNLTIHDLRHAAGTLAAWTGATTKELMSRMGHSTMSASLRYQHAAQSRDAEIAEKLELFRPKAPSNQVADGE